MKKLRSTLSFYGSFAFPCLILTAVCMFFINRYGFSSFAFLFWFKIATLGVMYYLTNTYKHAEFYYYKNLGLTRRTLWISALGFDITLFLMAVMLILKLR